MTVYRDVVISDEEVESLREVERILRTLNDAVGGGSMYGVYADDLDILARRHDRAVELERVRAEVLTAPGTTVRLLSATGFPDHNDEAGRAHLPSARDRLRLIDGGYTA